MWRLINLIVMSICLTTALQADWDPTSLFQHNPETLNKLRAENFEKLKTSIKVELKNSWCSAEKVDLLMDLMVLTRPKVCVEIGAFTGSSVLPVAATLKYIEKGRIFAIDAWSNAEVVKHLSNDDPNKTWWSQVDMKAASNNFKKLIEKWDLKKICKEIPVSSEYAVNQVPATIDFLHLDGDYSEIGALRDVDLYLPKVKSGGYILLSNLYIMVNRDQPKIKAFCTLCDTCEIVASIEQDNAILFRKQ